MRNGEFRPPIDARPLRITQVLLSAVEEAGDRGLERLGIMPLVCLQELHTNERVDVCFMQQDANEP